VLDPDVAACEQNILRGVVTGGTGYPNALLDSHTDYGKTGTTDARADAWFIGATPQLATAVWFGYRFGEKGGAGFGGVSSAPIFRTFMAGALAGKPDVPLPDPGLVCARPGESVNPDGGRQASTSPLGDPGGLAGPKITQNPTTTTTTPGTPSNRAPTIPITPFFPGVPGL